MRKKWIALIKIQNLPFIFYTKFTETWQLKTYQCSSFFIEFCMLKYGKTWQGSSIVNLHCFTVNLNLQ